MTDNILLGDVNDYRRFIHECAMKNLKPFDKFIYYCSRWSGLLYAAVYDLRLKRVMTTNRAETKFHKVIVTSGTPVEVWIKDDNGKRSKVETERVYQDTEHNRAVIDWIKKNDQAVKEAREAKEELIKSLINIQL